MYELIFGRRPFRGRSNSDLTYSISKDPLKWPDDADKKCSRNGIQVIKGVSALCFVVSFWAHISLIQLLERDPAKRFGCKPHGEGFQELRRHPWFKPIDWDTLETKEQTSPFIPDVCIQLKLSDCMFIPFFQAKKANFDASHELEELLLEDNPLKAKARKVNQDNLSAEMRQMEEQSVVLS